MKRRLFSSLEAAGLLLVLAAPSAAQVAGNALRCDGVDDRATVPDLLDDLEMAEALTIEVWVRPDSVTHQRHIVTSFDGFEYGLSVGPNGQAGFSVTTPATDTVSSPPNLAPSAWTHLAGTYDGTTKRIYVNGVLAASKAHTGKINGGTQALVFCQRSGENSSYAGAIDEVRVWNVVRTGPQIAAWFDRKLTGTESGLVLYYRFDETAGQTLFDSSLAGNDGFLGATEGSEGNDATRTPSTAPLQGSGACVRNAQTACLLDGRFEVKVNMWNFANPPALFPGVIQTYGGQSSETNQAVSFYSFNPGNVEVFVKVLDACAAPDFVSFWLFAAGATTAETEILVRDTETEEVYRVFNPRHVLFESVADTEAFLACQL